MKKWLGLMLIAAFSLAWPSFSVDSMAAKGGWKKYCDFEHYPAGPFSGDEKWSVDEDHSDVADISIEDYNGSRQVKFTYKKEAPVPDEPCYLYFNECPESIVGIKADVTIASCTGNQDCRGLVAWHRGTASDNHRYIWEAIQVVPNQFTHDNGYISGQASILDEYHDSEWLGNAYQTNFNNWIGTIGETFTVSAIFDKPNQVTVSVEDQGTFTFKVDDKMGNPIELFKAIGMRVESGKDIFGNTRIVNGAFVAYFDNVYVKRKGRCDTKGPVVKKIQPMKNVPLDACWLNITFSEPMSCCTWDIQGNADWPIDAGTDTMWSEDMKTFSISRNNCGISLPENRVLEFVINPDGDAAPNYFKDLKGNVAKTRKIKIKTEKLGAGRKFRFSCSTIDACENHYGPPGQQCAPGDTKSLKKCPIKDSYDHSALGVCKVQRGPIYVEWVPYSAPPGVNPEAECVLYLGGIWSDTYTP